MPTKTASDAFCFTAPPKWFTPEWNSDNRHRDYIEREVIICFVGNIAERRASGRYSHVGAWYDSHKAVDYATYLCGSNDEIEPFLKWLWVRARQLITFPARWVAVDALAQALLKHKTIKYRDAVRVIANAMETDTK